MRFFLYSTGDDSIPQPPPTPELMEEMGKFVEEAAKSGSLVATGGFAPSSSETRVVRTGDDYRVLDGPYTEAKELFNGFWILDVSSKEEAKQWAQKIPLGKGVKVEVRRVSSTEEFPLDNPWIKKEIQWRADLAQKIADQARAEADKLA